MTISLYTRNIIYTTGGAESYAANLIESLQHIDRDFKISIITEHFANSKKLSVKEFTDQLNTAYGINLSSENLQIQYIDISIPFEKRGNEGHYFYYHVFPAKILALTKESDVFFCCAAARIRGNAKTNIAIIHFPIERKIISPFCRKYPILKPVGFYSDWKYIKNYSYFLPNSQFTAYWLRKKWGVTDDKIKVVYPPVQPVTVSVAKNKNQILVCSRIEKEKKIEELIRAYLSSEYLSAHSVLTVAGSTKGESVEYREHMESLSDKIIFAFDPTREQLEQLYGAASIFWHGRGFDETDPLLYEHFGITTVEAMSAGCIPVVINKGGQKEIVTENCGYAWDTLDELVAKTEMILKDDKKAEDFRQNAMERSKNYSKDAFTALLKNFLTETGII